MPSPDPGAAEPAMMWCFELLRLYARYLAGMLALIGAIMGLLAWLAQQPQVTP